MIIHKILRILSITLIYCKVSTGLNLGTVLFVEEDLTRKCWSPSNTKLLWTRLIVEDLLPCPTILNMIDDEILSNFFDYIKLVYATINKELNGNRKHVMLLAFSDALGGYMRHVVLPNVKYSFYAGTIDYSSVEEMMQLYKETKSLLKTSGNGWAEPICDSCCKCEPHSFSITSPEDCRACEALTLYYGPSFENCDGLSPANPYPDVAVPLPYFDRLIKPTVLAVPLKSYPLRGVKASWGLNLVVKYYLTGYKCLAKRKSTTAMTLFQNGVYSWMIEEVIPLLCDEEIYTVFGGVLRVMATLKRLGAKRVNLHALRKRYSHMADAYVRHSSVWTANRHKKIASEILSFLLFWFIFGFCFICLKLKRGKKKGDSGGNEEPQTAGKIGCKCEGFTGSIKSWFSKPPDGSPRKFPSRSRSPGEKDCMCFAVQEVYNVEETEEESFMEEENNIGRKNANEHAASKSPKGPRCLPTYSFGYDFQTSTSESPSDTDSEMDTHSQTPYSRSR